MRKKAIVSLSMFLIILINTLDVFGDHAIMPVYRPIYNETSYIISIIMKIIMALIIISYIVFTIVYMIKSKKDKNEKVKKLIKLLIITTIISLGLWFGSEKVKLIGARQRTEGRPHDTEIERFLKE